MGILDGGFRVEVKFNDYSSRSTYTHIYFEFWLWGSFNMFNIYMYRERNPSRVKVGLISRYLAAADPLDADSITAAAPELVYLAF